MQSIMKKYQTETNWISTSIYPVPTLHVNTYICVGGPNKYGENILIKQQLHGYISNCLHMLH